MNPQTRLERVERFVEVKSDAPKFKKISKLELKASNCQGLIMEWFKASRNVELK